MKYEAVELPGPAGRYAIELVDGKDRYRGPIFVEDGRRSARQAAADYADWSNRQHQANR